MHSSNLVGQILLQRFRVDSFIAAGGMGAVYKVWDLQRSVYLALKVLHSELAEDSAAFRRFKREADALKDLAHPNIVPFYGLYEDRGLSFILEGFINGPTLQDILRQRRGQPLGMAEAMAYLRALCASLGYAHSQGVIHCDVKPGNVMIDPSGQIFLTDFGIARHMESVTTTMGLTGTPAYMAPEQIRGEKLTPAADIYSLGVMLFEMLTGRRPFLGDEPGLADAGASAEGEAPVGEMPEGETPAERIRAAHLRLPPPDPRSINSSLPAALTPVILKALEKDPARRYPSANALFQAAASAFGLGEVPDRVAPPVPYGMTQMHAAGIPAKGVDAYGSAQPYPARRKGVPRFARTCLPIAAALSLVGLIALALVINVIQQRSNQAQIPVTFASPAPTAQPALTLPGNTSPPTATISTPTPTLQPTNAQPTASRAASPTGKAPAGALLTGGTPAPTPTGSPNEPPAGADRWTSPKDGMVLVRIPAGPFKMGSNHSPWDFEAPEHTVTLDEYWIDRVPVTNALFAKFVQATNYRTQAEKVGYGYVSPGKGEFQTNGADWRHPNGPGSSITGQDNVPVVQVSWDDARTYCEWAGRRLPTEAEWEKAARGDDGRLYPWGNQIDCSYANYSNGNNNFCTGKLTPVDAYPSGASPYGVLDMAGNTFDWVADWYQADYYKVSPAKNPPGPATGTKRVHRGGAWYNFDLQVQTTYRFANPPDWTFGSVGFRCAVSGGGR